MTLLGSGRSRTVASRRVGFGHTSMFGRLLETAVAVAVPNSGLG
jgi:hypothetical protein